MKKILLALCLLVLLMPVYAVAGCGDTPELKRQKAAFSLLGDTQKARVWRGKMNYILKTENLNKNQVEVIYEAIAAFKDDMFVPSVVKDKVAMAEFAKRVEANFDEKQIYKYFMTLSMEEAGGFALVPATFVKVTNPMVAADCTCSPDSHPLCKGGCADNNCNETSWGCGVAWYYACTKVCMRSSEEEGERVGLL